MQVAKSQPGFANVSLPSCRKEEWIQLRRPLSDHVHIAPWEEERGAIVLAKTMAEVGIS
jgi:hypothetical protein